MIPKKIHYVWVGGNPKPSNIKRCMKSWKRFLKDYEIIEWNESNFDIDSHPFAKAAYEAKKWAYVSDYIRAYAIYNSGGIYLDTDVIIVDKLDSLLEDRAFVGYENPDYPFTAVFGAEPNHPFVKDILKYYDNAKINFKFEHNNTISVSELLINKYGCKKGNKEQMLKTGIKVYKENILCNPSLASKTIHVFTGTWLDSKSSIKKKINKFLKVRLTNKIRIRMFLFLKKKLKI